MGRSPSCSKEGLNKGAWTAQEDKLLTDYIKAHGEGKWEKVRKDTGLKRCGKSCRLRWLNYLRPDIKRGNITNDEEDLVIRLHKLLGNRWSLIAGRLPGRTDNEIKNYWNTVLAKREQRKPLNHIKTAKKAITRKVDESQNPDVIHSKEKSPSMHGNVVNSIEVHSGSSDGLSPSTSTEENSLDLLMDFDVGEIGLSDFLNSDFTKLNDFEMFNMNSLIEGDVSKPAFVSHALLSPKDVSENWSVQASMESDFRSLTSFLESAEEWTI
ncbi:hypothetical protein ACB098_01G088700 [Castanea mollissima]|uniref:Uncharacterized protein n=1 Tax=Castanea mollissima TaxID=60419 RepID=A0A8J4RQB6_9ROSI|nr:hypothetical protein CMV_005369 [Castanea mollissima]